MQIDILQLIEGAKKAQGLTVIIDVFRAFTTACYIVNNNAAQLIPVGDIEEAYKRKKEDPATILIGERNENIPEGFDYGNSPSHIQHKDFSGKTVVHTTSSGTQGIVHANNADEIITGSFVNAGAVIRYIKQHNPDNVSLVCMGYATLYPTEEDTFCAEYIKAGLENNSVDFSQMKQIIRNTSAKRFFEEAKQGYAPSSDFDLCITLDTFNFVLQAVKQNQQFRLIKKEMCLNNASC